MEWDSNPRLRRDWCLKPAPWTARPSNPCRPPPPRARRAMGLGSKTKSLRRPGIKPGSRPWQGRILSLYYRRTTFANGSYSYSTNGEESKKQKCGVSGFRSQYLVLAKDARFRLRQYPTPSRRPLPPPSDGTRRRPASTSRPRVPYTRLYSSVGRACA